MNKTLITTALAIGGILIAAPVAAEEIDWTASQQCVQFDGTLLPEGTFRIVYPTELFGPNGYMIPAEATGTLLNGYNWPCAPLVEPVIEPAPVVVVAEPAPVAAIAAPAVRISRLDALASYIADLYAKF